MTPTTKTGVTQMKYDHVTIRADGQAIRLIGTALAAIMLTAASPGRPQSAPAKPAYSLVVNAAVATPVAVVDAFHAALASDDPRKALDFLAEDVLIFESGGVERSRAEYASHHLAADAAFSASVRRTLVSRSHGEAGNAAWITSVEIVAGAYRSRAINSRSVETMLLGRVAGKWRISHIHWSSKDVAPK
jgi:ketosteroid isomerase-like protein